MNTAAIENKTITISPEAFLPVARLVSSAGTDPSRPQLMGVFLNHENGKAIATNGHMMVEIELPIELADITESMLIDADICRAALKVKPREYSVTTIELSAETTTLKSAGLTLTRLNLKMQFPNTEAIKPKQNEEETISFVVNPELLVVVLESLREHKKSVGVTVIVNKANKMAPLVVSVGKGYGLVMPMRCE